MDEITLFKIKEWAELVKSANESPLTRSEWCKENNISEGAFYYWQRRVRKYALSAIADHVSDNHPSQRHTASQQPDFFEIEVSDAGTNDHGVMPRCNDGSPAGGITISSGQFEIRVPDDFSKRTLRSVLEVLQHV